jgi:hypothetical protein
MNEQTGFGRLGRDYMDAAAGSGDGVDRLPATMHAILFKSLTVRGFINYDFAAEHIPASCATSAPASPTAASGTARTSSMG